MVSKEARIH